MGFIKEQLRSVVEWESDSSDVLFHQWTSNGDELKNASKLIVKPGQGVIFVNKGKIEAVHLEEGMYDLETGNIPFLTTISRVMQSFESENKVGIYFFWQTTFLDQKWGTKSPIKYEDPKYHFPIGLTAFGNFSLRISNPESFFVNVVGSKDNFYLSDLSSIITSRLNQPLVDELAEANLSYIDIDKNRNELAFSLRENLNKEFEMLGFSLEDFRIESTDFDEATHARIGRIADITADSEAAKIAGLNYSELQKLEALKDAAKNEGGIAGMGVGMGAGMSFGQMMGDNMKKEEKQLNNDSSVEKLEKLKEMLDKGLITEDDYNKTKIDILVKF